MISTDRTMFVGLAFVVAAFAGCPTTAAAANRCVSPHGGGCYKTITAAVAAAAPNDVIRVGHGTYREDVVVDKPLSLLADDDDVVIDATGLLNGINVDGHGHAGLAHVIVSGFTVRNAQAQGILVTDAWDVIVSGNHLTGNDRALDPVNLVCPPLPPYFQAGEAFDCGEAIHLSGVHHSTISSNLVEHNAGGILISDDTGPNHDNLIIGNTVRDNPYDCGITIASHHFSAGPVADPAVGINHIVVEGNTSERNGLISGEGAGIGIFTGPPGGQNNGDVVINNVLRGNALPGVAIHSHAPFQTNNNHQIIGNTIADNGPDGDPGTTVPTGISISSDAPAGPPITGIVISQNVFHRESIDIVINTPAGSSMEAHLNALKGDVGVANYGAASISATANWWGCPKGPGAPACSTVVNSDGGSVSVDPWLTRPFKE